MDSVVRLGDNRISLQSGEIHYKYVSSKSHQQNIFLIFSSPNSEYNELIEEIIKDIDNDIIWIFDDLDGLHPLMLADGEPYLAAALVEFVHLCKRFFAVDSRELIFVGFEKFSLAALYFSLSLNAGACLTTLPMHADNVPCTESDINNIFNNAIDSAVLFEPTTNIYIIDYQENESLDKFSNYLKFNFIKNSVAIVKSYSDLLFYDKSLIRGILSLLGNGVDLAIGKHEKKIPSTYGETPVASRYQNYPEANLLYYWMDDDGVYTTLEALVHGRDVDDYGVMDRYICINDIEHRLGSVINRHQTLKYARREYHNYDASLTKNFSRSPVPIYSLPEGIFNINIKLTFRHDQSVFQAPLKSVAFSDKHYWRNNKLFRFNATPKGATLEVLNAENIQNFERGDNNRVLNISLNDEQRLIFRGVLAPSGAKIDTWGSATPYLRLISSSRNSRFFRLGLTEDAKENLPISLSKASYSDLARKGIDLSELKNDSYIAEAIMVTAYAVVSSGPIAAITVENNQITNINIIDKE